MAIWPDGKGARYKGYADGYVEEREHVHAERWEGDLAASYEAGKRFTARVQVLEKTSLEADL